MSKYDITDDMNQWEYAIYNMQQLQKELGIIPTTKPTAITRGEQTESGVKNPYVQQAENPYAPTVKSSYKDDYGTKHAPEPTEEVIEEEEEDRRYDNTLTAKQRLSALRRGEKLRLSIKENPQENEDWKWWCHKNIGIKYVNKYSSLIEKYAQQYKFDADLVKAVMFTENACGHYYGGNALMDCVGISKSQRPMNIRSDIWSNFQGKHYNTNNPEENIELSTLLLKQIYNSIENPTPEKVITIWNSAGRNTISSFGYRGGMAYRKKLWLQERGQK